jgi:hypothetical protein
VPWVREIVQKFDGIARSKKAILIPEIGIVSSSLSVKSVNFLGLSGCWDGITTFSFYGLSDSVYQVNATNHRG